MIYNKFLWYLGGGSYSPPPPPYGPVVHSVMTVHAVIFSMKITFIINTYFVSPVLGIVNNYVSTMITMINEDKDRTVVMAILLSLEEMLKSLKQNTLQGAGSFEGICTALKNVLMSKVHVLL